MRVTTAAILFTFSFSLTECSSYDFLEQMAIIFPKRHYRIGLYNGHEFVLFAR
jgi:hypothetical protein